MIKLCSLQALFREQTFSRRKSCDKKQRLTQSLHSQYGKEKKMKTKKGMIE
jgi:hypothetical protein